MTFNSVQEWLEHRNFEITSTNTACKGNVTVKFKDKTVFSITAGDYVILTLQELQMFLLNPFK